MKFPLKTKRLYKRKSTYKSKMPTKALTKAIQKVIHKDAETKIANVTFDAQFNSAATSSGDIIKVLPDIPQGGDNAQRIGDQLRGQKLMVKGHLILGQPYNTQVAEARIGVRMMIVSPKRFPSYSDAVVNSANWLNSVLTLGANEIPLDGTVRSLYLPVNHNSVTCYYDKVVYLTLPFVNGTTTSTSQDLHHSVKFFSTSFNLKNKLMRYDNLSPANQPNNYGPCFLFSYVHLDGNIPDTTNTLLTASFVTTFLYEDS